MRGLNAVGVRRLQLPFDTKMNAVYASNRTNGATNAEMDAIVTSSDELRRTQIRLGAKPLIVITAGNSDHDEWRALQIDLLRRSTKSRRIVAHGSGHYVHAEQPTLVVNAVLEVAGLKSDGPVE